MQKLTQQVHRVGLTNGVNVVAGAAASAAAALPNNSAGQPPKVIRVVATGNAHVLVGASAGLTASVGSPLVTTVPDFWHVDGFGGYFSVIQDGSGCNVNITPVEW